MCDFRTSDDIYVKNVRHRVCFSILLIYCNYRSDGEASSTIIRWHINSTLDNDIAQIITNHAHFTSSAEVCRGLNVLCSNKTSECDTRCATRGVLAPKCNFFAQFILLSPTYVCIANVARIIFFREISIVLMETFYKVNVFVTLKSHSGT